jgi:glycosyltransferase involved in cell wall biosynthesis
MEAPKRRILVIRSVNVHETARALRHLRSRYSDAEITLLLPAHLMEYVADSPAVDRTVVFDQRDAGRSWHNALALIRSLRRERFDDLVILCPNQAKMVNLHDIVVVSLFVPAGRRVILDGDLRESALSASHRVRAVLDSLGLLAASAVAAAATLLLIACRLRPEIRDRSRIGSAGARPRKIAMLVPILPDISHTFVYREVLALKQHGADFILVALEEGDYAVLHPEAKALLPFATFAPRLSPSRYLLYYLYFIATRPRRMMEVIRLYQSHASGDPLLFLRIDQFHNPLHPMHGIGLAWMLKRLGVTSLHVYGSTYPTTRAMAACGLLDIPFSTTAFVDFDSDYEFKMLEEKLRRSTLFVTHTDFCRARLRAVDGGAEDEKVRTIRIGIDPTQWPLVEERDNGRVARLVAVCRFVKKKGLDVLLRACALLKARGVAFQCHLIGDGPEMGRLQALAEELGVRDDAQFTGPISTDQVRAYLTPDTVIVAPSVYAGDGERDGIPTVLVEAMACGVPAVASAISGIPELIQDGECGLLVPEGDEQKLASAVESVLGRPDLRARFRRNGRHKVLREFDVRVNALRLWSTILKAHDRA